MFKVEKYIMCSSGTGTEITQDEFASTKPFDLKAA